MKRINITSDKLNEMEDSGLSEQQIANIIGCSRQALYKYRKRIKCPQKKRAYLKTLLTTAEKRTIHNNYQRRYTKANYKTRNHRQLRKIAIKVLGRRLKEGEVIHHIDRNPANNNHNNLIICTQSYHMSVLHKER